MKSSKFRKFVGIFGYVVVGLIAALLVFVLLTRASGNVAFIFGRTLMWVRTGSMEPTIPEKSYILVEKINAADVSVGDVIVFRSDDPALEGAYNTHRVVRVVGNNDEFVTKGDNNQSNPVEDKYTAKAANVIGVYRSNLPLLTLFGRFFATKIGIIVAFTLIFAVMLIIYVPDMMRLNRERTEELQRKRQEQIDERVRAEVERMKLENANPAGASPEPTASEPSEPEAEPEPPAGTQADGPETSGKE